MAVHLPFDGPGAAHAEPINLPPQSARPVFLDVTGARRRQVRRAGVVAAAASLAYLPIAASALLPGPTVPVPSRPPAAEATAGTGRTDPTSPVGSPFSVGGETQSIPADSDATPTPHPGPGRSGTPTVTPQPDPRTSRPPTTPPTRTARPTGDPSPLPSPTATTPSAPDTDVPATEAPTVPEPATGDAG
ncbi:hypothetical protein AB0C02_00510 [Micromonospora sp. NPDC048999]|uniref:hypothetical protein n=1 Tax=Micromonospora sp. NPDC048999 TaxID=3155391 RepID=UPI003405283A